MGDPERERERLSDPPDRNAVLRRDDPEHLALIQDMRQVKEDVRDLKDLSRGLVDATKRLADASEENERRMMGHWDSVEGEWRPGLLQTQQDLGKKLDALADTIKDTSRESGERITGTVKWVGGIVGSIIVAAATAWITLSIQQHANTITTLQSHLVH